MERKTFLAFNITEGTWNWDDETHEAKVTQTIVYANEESEIEQILRSRYPDYPYRWLIVPAPQYRDKSFAYANLEAE